VSFGTTYDGRPFFTQGKSDLSAWWLNPTIYNPNWPTTEPQIYLNTSPVAYVYYENGDFPGYPSPGTGELALGIHDTSYLQSIVETGYYPATDQGFCNIGSMFVAFGGYGTDGGGSSVRDYVNYIDTNNISGLVITSALFSGVIPSPGKIHGLTPLQVSSWRPTVCPVPNGAFVCGGWCLSRPAGAGEGPLDTVSVYWASSSDIDSRNYTGISRKDLAPLTEKVFGPSAVYLNNGYVLVTGGGTPSGFPTSTSNLYFVGGS
jgi:hypothetical protein